MGHTSCLSPKQQFNSRKTSITITPHSKNQPVFGEVEVKNGAVTLVVGCLQWVPHSYALQLRIKLSTDRADMYLRRAVRQISERSLVQHSMQGYRPWLHDEDLKNT